MENYRLFIFLLLVSITLLLEPLTLSAQLFEDEQSVSEQSNDENKSPKCSFGVEFSVPSKASIVAAGAFRGRRLSRQMDNSGYAATQIDILVNQQRKPVVLLLGAFEPTIWNLARTKETEIVAVVLSGYFRQEIIGLSAEVPLLASTYDNQGPCGHFIVTPVRKRGVEIVSQKLFSRKIDQFFFADSGSLIVGQKPRASEEITSEPSVGIESILDMQAPRSAAYGIMDALLEGSLRKPDRRDLRYLKLELKRKLDPRANELEKLLAGRQVYFVQKPFVYPAGLFKADAVVFVVGKGVAEPDGTAGDSVIINLN